MCMSLVVPYFYLTELQSSNCLKTAGRSVYSNWVWVTAHCLFVLLGKWRLQWLSQEAVFWLPPGWHQSVRRHTAVSCDWQQSHFWIVLLHWWPLFFNNLSSCIHFRIPKANKVVFSVFWRISLWHDTVPKNTAVSYWCSKSDELNWMCWINLNDNYNVWTCQWVVMF